MVSYTLDGEQSFLAFTGEGTFGTTTVPFVAQGAGSLSVTYSGTIVADVTPTSIRLLPGTAISAGISGNWRPKQGGSTVDDPTTAPANYGYSMDLFGPSTPVFIALRGVQMSFSDAVAHPIAAGFFSTAGIDGAVTAGVADINYGNPPQSDLTFADPWITEATTNGSLTLAGGIETLRLPLKFTLEFNSAVFSESFYTGTLVATRAVPEPGTAASLLGGLTLLLGFGRSRRQISL